MVSILSWEEASWPTDTIKFMTHQSYLRQGRFMESIPTPPPVFGQSRSPRPPKSFVPSAIMRCCPMNEYSLFDTINQACVETRVSPSSHRKVPSLWMYMPCEPPCEPNSKNFLHTSSLFNTALEPPQRPNIPTQAVAPAR